MTENYTPQEGELVLVGDVLNEFSPRIFLKKDESNRYPFICVADVDNLTTSLKTKLTVSWKFCKRLNGEFHNHFKSKLQSQSQPLKLYL